jgi:hypothetical protein
MECVKARLDTRVESSFIFDVVFRFFGVFLDEDCGVFEHPCKMIEQTRETRENLT